MIEFYTPTARERLMRYFKKNPRASDETDEHFLTRARGQEALSDRQIAAAERAALQERASDFAYRLIHNPPAEWDALSGASALPAEWLEPAIRYAGRLLRDDIAKQKKTLQLFEQHAAAFSQWRKSRRNGVTGAREQNPPDFSQPSNPLFPPALI